MKKWLKGDTVRCEKLVGRNGRQFAAVLSMTYNADSQYGGAEFNLVFGDDGEK